MRIWITVDMEGIAGIPVWEFATRDSFDYNMGRDLMIGEVNAAVEGALLAGAKEIIINDSHDMMINLLPEKIHPAAKLLQGSRKPFSMAEGLNYGKYDAAMFVGYHSMAGSLGSLSHTYTGAITRVCVNDETVGEFGLNATMAGYYGIPAVFIAGDEEVCAEAKKKVSNIVTAPVKKALGKKSCLSVHPSVARAMIKENVQKALQNVKSIKPIKVKTPITVKVAFHDVTFADVCTRLPGAKRLSPTELSFTHKDFAECYKAFLCMMAMGH